MQLLTVEDLLMGKQLNMPPWRQVDATLKRAAKAETAAESHGGFDFGADEA